MRNRTVNWCENKILEVLGRHVVSTYLALSALTLENVRSIEEQVHLDIALENLLSRKRIKREKIQGYTTYSIRAA